MQFCLWDEEELTFFLKNGLNDEKGGEGEKERMEFMLYAQIMYDKCSSLSFW